MNYNEIADALKSSGNEEVLKLIKNKLCSTESGKAEYEEAIKEKDYYDLQDRIRYIKDIDPKMLEIQNIIEVHMDMTQFYKSILTQEKQINPKFFPGMIYPVYVNNSANDINTLAIHGLLEYIINKKVDYDEKFFGVPVFYKSTKQFGSLPQIGITFVSPDSKEAEPFIKVYRAVKDTYIKKYTN